MAGGSNRLPARRAHCLGAHLHSCLSRYHLVRLPLCATFPLLIGIPTVIIACWYFDPRAAFFAHSTECRAGRAFYDLYPALASCWSHLGEALRMPLFVADFSFNWVAAPRAGRISGRETRAAGTASRSLILADAERRLAEERALATEALRDRDEMLRIALDSNGMGLWVRTATQHGLLVGRNVPPRGDRTGMQSSLRFEAWIEMVVEDGPGTRRGSTETILRDRQVNYHEIISRALARWLYTLD